MAGIEELLSCWFGAESEALRIAHAKAPLWWGAVAETDAEINARFGQLHDEVSRGEHADWASMPEGRLALIVVLDQFSRMRFRGTPQAFASDMQALALCLQGLGSGQDLALRPIERVFFYLPLEHAEDRGHQQRSVTLFESLATQAAENERKLFEDYAEFARRHRDIVARFGRFPHRNAVLGRDSTEEERKFLQQPGSSF